MAGLWVWNGAGSSVRPMMREELLLASIHSTKEVRSVRLVWKNIQSEESR